MGELWTQSIKFTSGTGVVYHPGLLVLEQDNELAKKIIVGSVSIESTPLREAL